MDYWLKRFSLLFCTTFLLTGCDALGEDWAFTLLMVVLIAIVVLLILAAAAPELAAALLLLLFEWIVVRFIWGFLIRKVLWEWIIKKVIWEWIIKKVIWEWILKKFLRDIIWRKLIKELIWGRLLRPLLERLPWWDRWKDNALWDVIKIILAAGACAGKKIWEAITGGVKGTTVPCGSSVPIGPVTATYSENETDFPGGKNATQIRNDAITTATTEATQLAQEQLQKQADNIVCMGGCTHRLTNVSVTTGTPVTVVYKGGLIDVHRATVTATATGTVVCD